MKAFRILLFVLAMLPCANVFAQTQNANTLADDVHADYSKIKGSVTDLLDEWNKEKIKEGLVSVGSDELDELKQSLEQLKSLVSNSSSSDNNEKVKQLTEAVKEQFEKLKSLDAVKNNDYIKGLTDKYEKLKKDINDFGSRLASIKQFGISGNMPVGIVADFGGVGVKVGIDSLVMHRDDKIETINGDSTGAYAFAELKLPFLPKQSDSSQIIKFGGHIVFQKGSKETSLNTVFLENDIFEIPIIKNKVSLELIDGDAIPSKQWGGCTQNKSRNFVSFDCEEVKEVNLIGRFKFDPSFIKATTFEAEKKGDDQNDANKKEEGEQKNESTDETKKEGSDEGTTVASNNEGGKNDDNQSNKDEQGDNKDGKDGKAVEKDVVYAYFSCRAKGGIVADVCFSSPFELVKLPGFKFQVEEAVIDLSDIRNANGFAFPDNYWDEEGLGLNGNNWTGFFLKKLKVMFPNELTMADAEDKDKHTIIEATNVLIDDYGFTGSFVAENLMNKDLGSSGANITIKKATAEVLKGDFIKGSIEGKADVPFLAQYTPKDGSSTTTAAPSEEPLKSDEELKKADKEKKILSLDFYGRVGLDNDKYTFFAKASTGLDQYYKVPFTDMAYITVAQGTGLELTNEASELGDSGKKLKFALTLNGGLNIESGKLATSKGSSKLGFDAKFEGVEFQGLRFCNIGKHVSLQSLALKGDVECRMMGLTLTLTKLEWKDGKVSTDYSKDFDQSELAEYGDKIKDVIKGGGLDLGSRIQLMSGNNTIAPELGGLFKTIYKGIKVNDQDALDLAKGSKWNFNGIQLNRIALKADFSAFSFDGSLDIFKDDEDFGKGFRGKIGLAIDPIGISLDMQAVFGKKEDDKNNIYKYWFARATADMAGMTPPILLFPPSVFLKSVTGGAYYHMVDKNASSQFDGPDGQPTKQFTLADADNYVPDNSKGLGFIAGVGVYVGSDNLANVQAELNISFNSNWSLHKIQLGGNFTMISPMPAKFQAAVDKYNDAVAKFEGQFGEATGKVLSNLKDYNKFTQLAVDKSGVDNTISLQKLKATQDGTIYGWLNAEYWAKEKKFHCEANVDADLFGLIKGNAWFRLHTEPGDWYMRLGSNSNPCYLKFMDWAKGQTYFMMGTLPSHTIKPLSETAASKFGVNQLDYSGSSTSLEHARGFAFALDVNAKVDVDIMKIAYFQTEMGVGTDLMVSNRCYTYGKDNKKKHWRASGDLYAYASVQCGLEWPFPEKKFRVFRGAAFVGFQGALPAPVYGRGIMSFSVDVLDFIEIDDLTATLTVGNNDIKDCE